MELSNKTRRFSQHIEIATAITKSVQELKGKAKLTVALVQLKLHNRPCAPR